jgi:multidrug efflux system membrane fusion protein
MIDRRSFRLVAAAAAATTLLACGKKAPPPPQAVPVTVGKAELRTVPYVLQANGMVEPMQTVQIQPQVGGLITKILFKEGDDVKEGQPLFEIDPRTYQASLQQAQAVVERDRAQLASANSDVSRYGALVDKNYVTSQQMEQVKTTAASMKATLAADEALAQQAQLNFQYATIRSPISGRAGSLQVRVGYLAKVPATTPLVTINQIHPILVRFAVPAASLQRVRQYASTTLPVSAHPASAPGTASTGTLSFVDNAIDTTTGTILLKGTFENKDGALWPGEFVTASLELFQQQKAIVVPSQAVVEGQNGNFLFVINADSTATQREITIDRTAGDYTIISQGVKAGEQVVTDGQLRLNTGTKVQIKPPAGGDQQRAG